MYCNIEIVVYNGKSYEAINKGNKMRKSTVKRISKKLLVEIAKYCRDNNCGYILRANGQEIGAKIVNGVLTIEFVENVYVPISRIYLRKGCV